MPFYSADTNGYIVRIKLSPGASNNGFHGVFYGGNNIAHLKASVTVVPEKGKANKELISMLAKKLKIAKSSIDLISGETDHMKKLRLLVTPSAEFEKKLQDLVKE